MTKVINGYLKIDGKLVKVSTSRIIDNIGALEENIAAQTERIDELKSEFDEHIIESGMTIDNLTDKVSSLESVKQDSIEDIAEIRENAAAGAALSSDISEINSSIQTLDNKIGSSNNEMKQYIDEKIESLSGKAASIILRDWRE